MMKTISIIGCGWLGFPLALKLKEKGFEVKGSVTSLPKTEKLQEAGIRPYYLIIHPEQVELTDNSFFQTDLVIVAIPPKRIDSIEAIFPQQIRRLIELLEAYNIPRVLFISSTSVYNETNGIVQENDAVVPEKPSGKALLLAEQLLTGNPHFQTTVLRFGGLIGADRNPARFLSRSKTDSDGAKPVNLIHQDDCIRIIEQIIEKEAWGNTFNACCPEHPAQKEFYEKASQVSGFPLPQFDEQPGPYKIVDSSKLIGILNYRFIFNSPVEYLESLTGTENKMNNSHLISITGVGPGDPDLLTVKALRRIEQADVILYDALHGTAILNLTRPGTKKIYVGKLYNDGQRQTERQELINQQLKQFALEGNRVVRLKAGDPFIFGRGAEELEFCLNENLNVEVIPGITSGFAAAADFHIPVTLRKQNSMALLYTGHLTDGTFTDAPIVADVLKTNAPVMVYMGLNNLVHLSEELLAHGVPPETSVQIASCVGSPAQKLFSCQLGNINNFLKQNEPAMPSVIIMGTHAKPLNSFV
ncbi:MAG: uroporphyrinogen-III C-methyltransferase [Bacteroidetes bacterium GWF2_42_66]|nr:MAG: uroporphyrinogen-III C-methyltransferase [Bacteroidetes bacterium GWA2_42_15]OFX97479.1 MAG: uroporphyrinogen-III C-methyltransferase [Bacteroidetes bacterium GWE2_42_39]OFY43826.1 MAG: uroporphyrinogen-III C-methyltransferase [Bacteroidetes bacterium GWF2_42_66]HBL76188.1 uroporphyrinogen-III C-methyltransferase [Prolixibacteraceae bacterium]HCU60426.1 uroporphyrinogen-III C-methyltransferase [Prolixibacteraceae bacterium]